VRYPLKTPWKNGTTQVEFEPVEFIGKLAALVPPPRADLSRFHSVSAPNANLRAQLTPSGRGKRPITDEESTGTKSDQRSPDEKRRQKPEGPTAIRANLAHFERHGAPHKAHSRTAPRALPTVAA